MRLEAKLGISSGVLIFAMFGSALLAHLRLASLARQAYVVDGERIPFILNTSSMGRNLANSVLALEATMIGGEHYAAQASMQDSAAQAQASLEADLGLLQAGDDKLDLGPDEGKLQAIAGQARDVESLEREAEALRHRGTAQGASQARALLETRIIPTNAALQQATSEMIEHQMLMKQAQVDGLNRIMSTLVFTLWTATIVGAILGGLVSLYIARRILRGISLVAARANAIASGDLTDGALDVGSCDQIASLGCAMEEMQLSLSSIIRSVAQTASTVTADAISMSSATDHIHRRVDQQTQQTQQAATAMQEMSASIAEVSRHTHSAAETARSAAQTAHEGGDIVKQMLEAMHSIAAAVSDTSSTIGLLGEDSHRISQIVTVIDEIATKTNLLALNAAIEAARAGDHGRGFAVVAGEVRRLAESTAQATGEISAMIQGIQNRTRTAIASMASGTATVQQGVVTTNRAGEALERIIGIAERVDRMIAQIAIAASQQAAAADQSSSSLDSIHTLSTDNLSEMATTTAGIESLRSTAAALERQVECFRLGTPRSDLVPKPALSNPRAPSHSQQWRPRKSGSSPRRTSPRRPACQPPSRA